MEKIAVFLVDGQRLFRQGMRMVFSETEDIEVVGECDVAPKALTLVEAFDPRVVLVDSNPPLWNGLDLARQITLRLPGVGVIIMTTGEDEDELFQAIKAGARAYLNKSISGEELVSVVRRVFRGEPPICDNILSRPSVARRVLKEFQDLSFMGKRVEAVSAPLSPRELEILGYVARGFFNKQIAYTLSISEQTIKNHITSILRKLDANDRTHAVVMALRHGWLALEDTEVEGVPGARIGGSGESPGD